MGRRWSYGAAAMGLAMVFSLIPFGAAMADEYDDRFGAESPYGPVLDEYFFAVTNGNLTADDLAEMNVNSDSSALAEQPENLQYALTDIDSNGQDEFVVSYATPDIEGGYSIIDIRYAVDGEVLPDLSDGQYDPDGIIPGSRSHTYLLNNGYIYTWGWSPAGDYDFAFYLMTDDGPVKTDEFYNNCGECQMYTEDGFVSCTLEDGQQILEDYGLTGDVNEESMVRDAIGTDVTGQCRTDIEWQAFAQ